MRDPNDNLDRIYKSYKTKPEELRKAYDSFNAYTEKTYQAFKEIMEEHPDIGKAAMVITARNQASHIVSLARDESKNYKETLYSITALICPMFQMLYDRLVSETIEAEMSGLSDEGEETDGR